MTSRTAKRRSAANARQTRSPGGSSRFFRLALEPLEDRRVLSVSVTDAHVSLPETSLQTLLPYQAIWRYFDEGTDPGADWNQRSYDDRAWPAGLELLGFGLSLFTQLGSQPIDCGPTAPLCTSDNFATTHFRTVFSAETTQEAVGLIGVLRRNEATAVYLNGFEVYRDAGLAPDSTFETYATQSVPEQTVLFAVDPRLLVPGANLVATEVHLASPSDSRMLFALDLMAVVTDASQPIQLEVEFSRPIDPDSVQPEDLLIDGVSATGVTIVDRQTAVFDLPSLSVFDPHVASIPAGAILEAGNEQPVETFEWPFELTTDLLDTAPQYLVKQTPRLQPGDMPLAGFPGAETDQVDVLWETVPVGLGTRESFSVEFRLAGTAGDWQTAVLNEPVVTGVEGRVIHSATLAGLAYDTDYEYRVRHWRGTLLLNRFQHTFHTRLPAGSSQPFTFAAYGDSAEIWRVDNFRAVQDKINQSPSAFALSLGDNVYPTGTHPESDARFDPSLNPEAAEWIAGHLDYAAIGNHETYGSGGQPFREYFANPIPQAGVNAPAEPPATEAPELNYSFDYGNVHFVTFDTNSLYDAVRLDGLLDWVEADLAASDATWKIVFGHHTLAFVPDKSDTPSHNYYQQMVPRLRAAGVDVFLVGHSHTFSWTKPLLGQVNGQATFVDDRDKVYAKGAGLVQVVSGVGGRTLRPGSYSNPGQEAVAAGYTTETARPVEFGFAQFDVTPTSLTMTYIAGDDGEAIDSFSIVSREDDVLTFQQGVNDYVGTVDTMLRQSAPFTNLSVEPTLGVVQAGAQGGESHGLLRFDGIFGDGPNQIPPDATIRSAVLQLEVVNGGDDIALHRMLRDWFDTNTWNGAVNGIQPDGSEASTVADAVAGGGAGSLTVDVTRSLEAWLADPASNLGWALLPTGTDGVVFHSAEGPQPPRLVVEVEAPAVSRPTANILDVTPNPRLQDVDEVSIVFSEAVTGFDRSDVTLARNGGENLLPPEATLTTLDNVMWTLGNLGSVTDVPGLYRLTIRADGSRIVDVDGNGFTQTAESTWLDVRQAGDVNLDRVFDQRDIVQVLQAGQFYLSGRPASWSEGDWNGDGFFDQRDIVAALQTGNYLQGPYAADALVDLVMDLL